MERMRGDEEVRRRGVEEGEEDKRRTGREEGRTR